MPSVQERARQIELSEQTSKNATHKSHASQQALDEGSHSEYLDPLTLHKAPPRRIIDWPETRHSGTSLPSRYRANGFVLDFEGVSLEEGPRPLLPPRPISDESNEGRRASDGGAICTLTIKRNPLCDTFEAMSTGTQSTRLQRSKSLVSGKPVPPPILVYNMDVLKGSDFGAGSTADDSIDYDPYRAPPKTANLIATTSSKGLLSTVQGYLKAPYSPGIKAMQQHVSQVMSPVFSTRSV